jgi:Tol biopolymer transport system component
VREEHGRQPKRYTPAVPLGPGSTLGPYELRGLVGAGGMGEVYRAYDPRLDRDVALKIVPDDLTADPRRRERFRREAHAIAALTHPHIVTVHSAEDIDGHLVLVMELVEGQTLADLLPSGGMSLSRVVKIAIQIADALGAAHDRGIIHRDLKPRNVMVTPDGRVKVLDFGLAKMRDPHGSDGLGHETASLHALTAEGRIVGTAAYMSPEQAEGRHLDHRTDLFSFGILLYELSTGTRPFLGDSVVSLLSSILRDVPRPVAELNPRLPREFARIVRRCLAKDPDERYQSAKDLRLDLEELRQDSASGDSSAATAALRPAGHRLPRPLLIAAAAVGGLLIGGAIAVPLLRGRAQPPGAAEHTPHISPDGQWVTYTRAVDGVSNVYLQAAGGERAVNLTGESASGNGQAAFSFDGTRIAFRSSRGGGGLFVMGRTGELVRQITDSGYSPAWSPDGTRLAYSSGLAAGPPFSYAGGSTIWVVDIASGQRRKLSDLDGVQPSWSPHDRRIAFWGVDATTQNRDIWTVPVDGGTAVRVTDDAATDATPVWSSDGRHLYFSSSRGGTTNLWRVPIDETTGATAGPPQPVTVPTQNAIQPSLARDGRSVAYTASTWSSNVYALGFDAVAGAPTPASRWVLGGPHDWTGLRIAPDGRRLAVVRSGETRDLVVAAADGTGVQRLTDEQGGVRCPYWSPDGSTIVVLPTRRGDKALNFLEPDGGRARRVTDLPSTGLTGCPVWSPDGRQLAVAQGPADPAVVIFDPTRPVAGQRVERLPPPARGAFFPRAWSPDGTKLGGTIGGTVAVLDRKTGRYTLVAAGTPVNAGGDLSWLPDSRRLLSMAGGRDIVLFDTVAGVARTIYSAAPDALRSFALSPDGRELYVSRGPDEADIWIGTIQTQ